MRYFSKKEKKKEVREIINALKIIILVLIIFVLTFTIISFSRAYIDNSRKKVEEENLQYVVISLKEETKSKSGTGIRAAFSYRYPNRELMTSDTKIYTLDAVQGLIPEYTIKQQEKENIKTEFYFDESSLTRTLFYGISEVYIPASKPEGTFIVECSNLERYKELKKILLDPSIWTDVIEKKKKVNKKMQEIDDYLKNSSTK